MELTDTIVQHGDKILKNSTFIGSVWSGAIGGLATAVTTENVGVTTVVIAASGMLGALFSKIPDIIKARAESKKLEQDVHEVTQDKLIAQIYLQQDREREAHEKEVKQLQAEILILRTSKHEVLNEIHALTYWIYELRDILSSNNIEFPKHTLRNMAELVRSEDKAMKQIQQTYSDTPYGP